MQKITVYDVEAEKLDELEDKYETTAAYIIQVLLEAVEAGYIDLSDWI